MTTKIGERMIGRKEDSRLAGRYPLHGRFHIRLLYHRLTRGLGTTTDRLDRMISTISVLI